MAAVNPYLQYQQQSINTATPGMLIVMLFESAVKNINLAVRAIDDHNVEASHNALIKVQNIYSSLDGYLNPAVPLSADLHNWYEYILRRLMEANIKKDKEILSEVLSYTVEFRDTWKEAEKKIHLSR